MARKILNTPDSGFSKYKTSERPNPYQNKTNANFMDGLSIFLNVMVNFEPGAPSQVLAPQG
jgi:hypothetical protein